LSRIGVGVVGYGYWGPNLARNMNLLSDARLVAVCDASTSRLAEASRTYVGARTTHDLDIVLSDPEIDAVVLATPAATHYAVGRRVLLAGKHLLVEKPLAMSVAECQGLIGLAETRSLTLMVGHTFLYNSAVCWLREFIDKEELGDIFYVSAQRLNLGTIRQDINVMWNLAPHDISVLLYLLRAEPVAVTAHGQAYLRPEMQDVAFLTLEFSDGQLGHIHVSWLDPRKVRRITVVGRRKMVVYDDVDADARIQVFDKGVDVVGHDQSSGAHDSLGEFQMLVRSGDLLIPHVEFHEPLRVECQEFLDAINEQRPARTDGYNGLQTVRVLEAAQQSLDSGGHRVPLDEISTRVLS
jgi:predicted dehydrogenase